MAKPHLILYKILKFHLGTNLLYSLRDNYTLIALEEVLESEDVLFKIIIRNYISTNLNSMLFAT